LIKLDCGGIRGLGYLKNVLYIIIKMKMKDFRYLKAYFSPFKLLKPRFYIGKTAIGTPYFYPRKWVKATPGISSRRCITPDKTCRRF
jgi:hypothetical protein